MDQLTAIKVFQKIVESRSFSKAAAQLNMPRSTVSKALVDLEEYLGTKLIHRTTRSLALTVEGSEYYNRVGHLILDLQEADEALQGMGAIAKGRLRIDVHSSLANFVLLPILKEFRQEYPNIQLTLGISDRPVNLIEDGVDCAIRAGELVDSTLIGKTIYLDQLITCASPDYIERYGMPMSLDELDKDHQIVGYVSAVNGEIWPMMFNLNGVEKRISRFNISSNDSAGHIGLIAHGHGIGQTHTAVVKHLLASGALVPILLAETNANIPISLIYPPTKRLSARVRLFVDWVIKRLSNNI